MKKFCLASLVIAAMLGAGCNKDNTAAKNDTAGTSGRADKAGMGDRDFVQDVTKMNAAEIELARLAADHGSAADVKQFAQMMVDDHTAAGAKLSGLATQNAIEAPAQPDDSSRSEREKLSGKSGPEFDKDFIDAMVDGHQKFVDKLESRIDRDTVTKYKATVESQVTGEKTKVDVKAQTVTPEKSDDPITQRINAWAA